jgi:hypothetical protein
MGIDAATMVMDGSEVPKMNKLILVAGIDEVSTGLLEM